MEALVFGITLSTFFAPVLVAYSLYATWDRAAWWLKVLGVVVAIVFVASIQYSWVQQHGYDLMATWFMYLIFVAFFALFAIFINL